MNIAQLTKPSRILIEQDSDPTLLNFKREMFGLPFDEQVLLNDTRYMQKQKSVLSSKMTSSIDSTITIFEKSVTYRSFCQDNYSKCFFNHCMEQLANTQAFQKRCKKSVRSITSVRLQLLLETGSVTAKYAFKTNAKITHESPQNGISDGKTSCKSTFYQNYRRVGVKRISLRQ